MRGGANPHRRCQPSRCRQRSRGLSRDGGRGARAGCAALVRRADPHAAVGRHALWRAGVRDCCAAGRHRFGRRADLLQQMAERFHPATRSSTPTSPTRRACWSTRGWLCRAFPALPREPSLPPGPPAAPQGERASILMTGLTCRSMLRRACAGPANRRAGDGRIGDDDRAAASRRARPRSPRTAGSISPCRPDAGLTECCAKRPQSPAIYGHREQDGDQAVLHHDRIVSVGQLDQTARNYARHSSTSQYPPDCDCHFYETANF